MYKDYTPMMGWASWNCFRTKISEDIMKAQTDALLRHKLNEYGYIYINTDDGFFGGRDKDGTLKFHKERFPNGIKCLADYIHGKGLLAGIYSDAGHNTCGYYWDNEGENGLGVGLYNHEEQDLKMYLEDYGFDFIKVDWGGGERLGLDEQTQYTKIADIIHSISECTNRNIKYNICRWQFPGEWAVTIADSWRTGGDIAPDFSSVLRQLDNVKPLRKYCTKGHYNDLDMLQVGNGMTKDEDTAHFAMWYMMSTPLMIGCDLTKITDETLEILKNRELIALNKECTQAYVAKEITEGNELIAEIWIKPCKNKKAIALLNRSNRNITVNFNFEECGISEPIDSARDLISHKEIQINNNENIELSPHSVKVFVMNHQNANG